MTLPHEPAFALRPYVFWAVALLSVVCTARAPHLETHSLLASVGCAMAVAIALYYYTRWITRLDGRFRHVHPRKIHVTTLASFYAPVVAALLVAASVPWLTSYPSTSALERATMYLAPPCLLAAAAGALRGGRESGVV
jgi:hypothetical protein